MGTDLGQILPRIRKVIMENFLSFSRQEVELDPKFSIIVGPNGSGKSSIFQAIKFALGSNDKDNRYSKWSDFIRFGKEYARVELEIVRGEDLVHIRRTTYQNGKITYEIRSSEDQDFHVVQKNAIDDLALALGYSTENVFAFVSQGKIDAVKNMDPRGLCTYLEEGLGMFPLRQKITQEEERVRLLDQELAELRQRKSIYDAELDFLKPKLERLARKRKILADLKILKEELMIANRQKIINDIESLKEEKSNNATILTTIEGDLARIKEQEDKIIQETDVIETELNKRFDLAGQKRSDVTRVDGEIKTREQEKQAILETLRTIDIECKEKEKNLAQKAQIEVKIREKLNNTTALVKDSQSKYNALLSERDEIRNKLIQYQEWQNKYTQQKNELDAKQQRDAGINQNITSLEAQSSKYIEQIAELNHKCEKIYKILEKWDGNLEKNYQTHRVKLRKEIFDSEAALQELNLQRETCLRELARYEHIIAGKSSEYPQDVRQITAEITRRNWPAKGPLLEIMHFDPRHSHAVETIFGKSALYGFIAEDRETFILLTQLRKNLRGFCKIFLPKDIKLTPLPPLPQHEGIIGYLFDLIDAGRNEEIQKVIRAIVGNAILVERISVGLDLHNAGVDARCVTLDGEILVAHRHAEESRPSKDLRVHIGIQQCKLRADQCKAKITQFEGKIETKSAELKQEKEKFERLEKVGQLLPTLQDLCKSKEDCANQNHRVVAEKASLEKEHDAIQNAIINIKEQMKEMEHQVGTGVLQMEERERSLPVELEECLNNLNNLTQLREAASQDYQTVFQVFTEMRVDFEKIQSRKSQIIAELERSDSNILSKFHELRKLERELANLEEKIAETKNHKLLKIQEKKAKEDQILNLRIAIDRTSAEIHRLENLITELEQNLRKIMEQLSHRAQLEQEPLRQVEVIQEDINHVTDVLGEYVDVDDHVEIKRGEIVESIARVQNHQDQVAEEIHAAASVIDQLKAEFYSKLKAALIDLEMRMNEKFTHHSVNYRLSLMLDGSFSSLEITLSAGALSNPLRPITALSGGQRTMIAINLVLALQTFNPSPIIIFDEAEMFLDKKNASVVSKLVGETTNNGIQIIMLMPDSSKGLITLANRVIGVALAGPNGPSSIIPDPHLLTTPSVEDG